MDMVLVDVGLPNTSLNVKLDISSQQPQQPAMKITDFKYSKFQIGDWKLNLMMMMTRCDDDDNDGDGGSSQRHVLQAPPQICDPKQYSA